MHLAVQEKMAFSTAAINDMFLLSQDAHIAGWNPFSLCAVPGLTFIFGAPALARHCCVQKVYIP